MTQSGFRRESCLETIAVLFYLAIRLQVRVGTELVPLVPVFALSDHIETVNPKGVKVHFVQHLCDSQCRGWPSRTLDFLQATTNK